MFTTRLFSTRWFTTRQTARRMGGSLVATLVLCGCGQFPAWYAPPEQRPTFDDPERWERVIRMSDVDARDHFVADIADPLAATWRWAGKRPMVRLTVPPRVRLKYHIEFAISEETFKSTGPVTLTFLVSGHALAAKRYTAAGSYEFEMDVPPEWISTGEVRLGAEIDKVFSPKAGGPTYGFLLIGIGLKRN